MKILLVFAHPDDETFLLGGTIIKLNGEGHTLDLICATRGEAGLPGIPPITTMEELPSVREKELRDASEILGIRNIYFLDYKDGTLENASANDLKYKIMTIIKSEIPDVVITFDNEGITNHPDHKAISRACSNAFQGYMETSEKHVQLYHTANPQSNIKKLDDANKTYNAFGKITGIQDSLITTRINITNVFPKKVTAMKMHKTQNKNFEDVLNSKTEVDLNFEYLRLVAENGI